MRGGGRRTCGGPTVLLWEAPARSATECRARSHARCPLVSPRRAPSRQARERGAGRRACYSRRLESTAASGCSSPPCSGAVQCLLRQRHDRVFANRSSWSNDRFSRSRSRSIFILPHEVSWIRLRTAAVTPDLGDDFGTACPEARPSTPCRRCCKATQAARPPAPGRPQAGPEAPGRGARGAEAGHAPNQRARLFIAPPPPPPPLASSPQQQQQAPLPALLPAQLPGPALLPALPLPPPPGRQAPRQAPR